MYSRASAQYVLETLKYVTQQGNDTSPNHVKHIFPGDQKPGPDTAGSNITAVFEARENRWEKQQPRELGRRKQVWKAKGHVSMGF